MQIIRDIPQGSDEWHALRWGKQTASRFKDVKAGGQGKTRKSYMIQLATERLTELNFDDSYTNSYMEWGTATEPQARAMHSFVSGEDAEEITFIDCGFYGSSPDALIGKNGALEIKCPKSTTQVETYLSGKMPAQHKPQVQGHIYCGELEWCDFVSFDPRIKGPASYFCERVYRDDEYIKELAAAIRKFEDELGEMMAKLRG